MTRWEIIILQISRPLEYSNRVGIVLADDGDYLFLDDVLKNQPVKYQLKVLEPMRSFQQKNPYQVWR